MTGSYAAQAADAVFEPMSEAEAALWLERQGAHIVKHAERYWEAVAPGFYQPVHYLKGCGLKAAVQPTVLSWGFRAALAPEAGGLANGSIPAYLLPDLQTYGMESLPRKRRAHLRKCFEAVRFVQVTEPTLLREQGYEVVVSALERTEHRDIPSRQAYLAKLEAYTRDPKRLIVAGLIGDRLGGYIDAYAIEETGYGHNLFVAREALSSQLGTGLIFEAMQVCRRAGLRDFSNGLHTPDNASLHSFKESLGFQLRHLPAVVRMNPLAAAYLRWRYPHKHYRLTGVRPSPAADGRRAPRSVGQLRQDGQ